MKIDDPRALPQERRGLRDRADLDDRIFTVRVAGEWLGMPVACVHTVFRIEALTPIPLAPPAIVGLVNLRGRIVTAVSLRRRLGLPFALQDAHIAIGVEYRGDALALVVDEAGDVLSLADADRIDEPRHMPEVRAQMTQSVVRLESGLLCILDMNAVFDLTQTQAAA